MKRTIELSFILLLLFVNNGFAQVTKFNSWGDVADYLSTPKTYEGGRAGFKGTIEIKPENGVFMVSVDGVKFDGLRCRERSSDLHPDYARFYVNDGYIEYPLVIHLGSKTEKPHMYFEVMRTESFLSQMDIRFKKDYAWAEYFPNIDNGKVKMSIIQYDYHGDDSKPAPSYIYYLVESSSSSQNNSGSQKSRPVSGTINGHEYVDLGLSVLWATCNVGASSPSDYGNYYAWGETSTKSSYNEENNKTYGKSMGSIAGNPQYDAARANWGGTWRLPTRDEIDELINRCTKTWTTQDGHNGYKVTGPNGNSIFLPAAGERSGSSLYGARENGEYWSAMPYEDGAGDAYLILFGSGAFRRCWGHRYYGWSVRPVSSQGSYDSTSPAASPSAMAEDDDRIYDTPEESAEFPGDVYAWLAKNIKYPAICQEQGVQGRVSVQFVINRDGSIMDVRVLRSPDDNLSNEAERLVKSMPKWKPARQGGRPVRMRYVLPVMFRLN